MIIKNIRPVLLCFLLCAGAGIAIAQKTYTVQKGDNAYTIAKECGLSVEALKKLNPNVSWTSLQIGQKLIVSNKPAPAKSSSHKVKLPPNADTATVTHTNVNLRSGPGTNFKQETQVDKGAKGKVMERRNGWTKIYFSASKIGWVRNDMVNITEHAKPKAENVKPESAKPTKAAKTNQPAQETKAEPVKEDVIVGENLITPEDPRKPAVITATNVNVRARASTQAVRVGGVTRGDKITVLKYVDGWCLVELSKGELGWIRRDMMYMGTELPQPEPKAGQSVIRILETAKKQLGVRYSWGGTNRSGFDCSGFVYYTYGKHGIKLPRTSSSMARVGLKVDRDDLIAGDLVFFRTSRGPRISHVGIYLGDGKFIHSSSGGGKVQVNSLKEGYYNKRYAGARRIIEAKGKVALDLSEFVLADPTEEDPNVAPEPASTARWSSRFGR